MSIKSRRMHQNRISHGFTLIEIMMVVLLSALILTPAYQIFKSGSQASLQGMQQIDMVIEGRRVLRQIHQDLKMACLALPDQTTAFAFADLMQVVPGSAQSLAGTRFTFLSFPLHEEIGAAVSVNIVGTRAPRYLSRITYILESRPQSPFLTLRREEQVHPALGGTVRNKVLSERVNFFNIVPVEISSVGAKNQWFYNVTLQLAEARNPAALLNRPAGTVLLNKANGLMLSDFFDVVYPEYFSALWNQEFINHGWHAGLESPP